MIKLFFQSALLLCTARGVFPLVSVRPLQSISKSTLPIPRNKNNNCPAREGRIGNSHVPSDTFNVRSKGVVLSMMVFPPDDDSATSIGTTLLLSALLGGDNTVDLTFASASLLWALNFYFGFDWLLAPLGLDNDFNPATRTTVALGRLLAGRGLSEAVAKPIMDTDGERPELGTRIGTGANSAYAVAIEESGEETDWLTDREAGLSSTPPSWLRFVVIVAYVLLGVLVTAVTDRESVLTAAVLAVIACVYEIGRPTLPTREEALIDAKLDRAVADFVDERVLIYGEDSSVRVDEAVNERELVKAFRDDTGYVVSDFPDFQIELRMRSYGTGRSLAGYIKGLRLVKKQNIL